MPGTMAGESRKPLIEIRGACKAFSSGSGGFALHPTHLTIGTGDYVAIVGKSGSGKSTLVNLIAGLDLATRGEVVVGGQDLAKLRESGRARWRSGTLGVVFQFYQLLPTLSILDNILLAMSLKSGPRLRCPVEHARDLLDRVGLAALADRLPSTLSGGQQQRAAIARALANNPPLLLMDEPTGSIDSEATQDVLALLDDLHARGRTLVVVTHDEDVAARAARRVTLRDGAVVSDQLQGPAT